jgi:hypothetical protein
MEFDLLLSPINLISYSNSSSHSLEICDLTGFGEEEEKDLHQGRSELNIAQISPHSQNGKMI